MPCRHPLDGALQQHGMVSRLQGVWLMAKIDLVLGRRGLGNQSVNRQLLSHAGITYRMHQHPDVTHSVNAIGIATERNTPIGAALGESVDRVDPGLYQKDKIPARWPLPASGPVP